MGRTDLITEDPELPFYHVKQSLMDAGDDSLTEEQEDTSSKFVWPRDLVIVRRIDSLCDLVLNPKPLSARQMRKRKPDAGILEGQRKRVRGDFDDGMELGAKSDLSDEEGNVEDYGEYEYADEDEEGHPLTYEHAEAAQYGHPPVENTHYRHHQNETQQYNQHHNEAATYNNQHNEDSQYRHETEASRYHQQSDAVHYHQRNEAAPYHNSNEQPRYHQQNEAVRYDQQPNEAVQYDQDQNEAAQYNRDQNSETGQYDQDPKLIYQIIQM